MIFLKRLLSPPLPFLSNVMTNVCISFNIHPIEFSFQIHTEHIKSHVSFMDVHLKSRCISFLARTLCTTQLRGIRARSIYIAIHVFFDRSEKFEWTLIPESILVFVWTSGSISTVNITFTFSNVTCERYLAPKREVTLTSFVGRDALSCSRDRCTSLSSTIPTTTRERLLFIARCRRFSWELPRSSVINCMNQMLHGCSYDEK